MEAISLIWASMSLSVSESMSDSSSLIRTTSSSSVGKTIFTREVVLDSCCLDSDVGLSGTSTRSSLIDRYTRSVSTSVWGMDMVFHPYPGGIWDPEAPEREGGFVLPSDRPPVPLESVIDRCRMDEVVGWSSNADDSSRLIAGLAAERFGVSALFPATFPVFFVAPDFEVSAVFADVLGPLDAVPGVLENGDVGMIPASVSSE